MRVRGRAPPRGTPPCAGRARPAAGGLVQRFVTRFADRQDGAGPVRAADQRAELMTALAVDADPLHAVQRVRLLETQHASQLPWRRNEEADATAAGSCDRREVPRRDLPAEGPG